MLTLKKYIFNSCHALLGLVLLSLSASGQEVDTRPQTGTRSGTLSNGMRYYVQSNAKWEGQPVSMNLYVHTGYTMEEEGQTDMAHYMEHLPYGVLREEALANPGALLEAIRTQKLPLQASTNLSHTDYQYSFDRAGSEIYSSGLAFFSRLISGRLKPDPTIINAEQGSFYQEYIHRNGPQNYSNKQVLARISSCIPNPVSPEMYYKHIQGFTWEKVSQFYNSWYHPDRATLIIVGPIEDLDAVEQDVKTYFGNLKATGSKSHIGYEAAYLNRPNQFVKLEESRQENEEAGETKIYLFWRNQVSNQNENDALRQKWMNQLIYASIEDYLRKIPNTYTNNYQLGIDKASQLQALGLEISTIAGNEKGSLQLVAGVINTIKREGITAKVFERFKSNLEQDLARVDTTSLTAVLNTIKSRILADESLELNQVELKKQWVNQLKFDLVNKALKSFLKSGPQDIALVAPEDTAILKRDESELRDWLNAAPAENLEVRDDENLHLIPESELAQLELVDYARIGEDSVGGSSIQLANGIKVVLYPKAGTSLKIHGFRKTGAGQLGEENYDQAMLLPKFIHESGIGAWSCFELQRVLRNLGMVYGTANYIENDECGIRLQAPSNQLESLLQLTRLYLLEPNKDLDAFKYWQQEELLFYKHPPYGREENDLMVLSKRELRNSNAGLTAGERLDAAQAAKLLKLLKLYRTLFHQPEEFTFLLSGDFTEAEVIPLLQRYLGNLPVSAHSLNGGVDGQSSLPKGPLRQSYDIQGILPSDLNLMIQYSYPISREDWKAQIDLKVIQNVIKSRLPELRFQKKRGLYVMSCLGYVEFDHELGNIVIILPTVKGMDDVLIRDVAELIDWFKQHPLSQNEFEMIKKSIYLSGITGNTTLEKAYRFYKWGKTAPKREALEAYLKNLNPEDIMKLINDTLVEEHRYVFVGKGKG